MPDYLASTYGDRIAEIYDERYGFVEETQEAVAALADLAGPGPVLELGVGTGRLAIPLAARGLGVHGIDASAAMLEKLRAKPGGEAVRITTGDFAEVAVDGQFALVYVAFNTLFALLTQHDQIRCFTNVARHLTAGGRFVVEAFVPDLARFDRNQRTSTEVVGTDVVAIEVSRHDPVHQRVDSAHLHVSDEGVRMYPVHIRYCWPSELDLMARLAGLELESRWGGWDRTSFTAASPGHVSVYRAPDA